MADFELQFPAGGSYTHQWIPSVPPLEEASHIDENDGIGSEPAADQTTQWGYRFALPFNEYTYAFDALVELDHANFKAFIAVVGAQAFDLHDATMAAGVYRKVKFAPVGYRRTWRYRPNGHKAVIMTFRDAS